MAAAAVPATSGIRAARSDVGWCVLGGATGRIRRSRVAVAAADHDFQPAGTVTPVGLLLPELDELFLYALTSRMTSDCLADRLA